jgi:hypothetical protein
MGLSHRQLTPDGFEHAGFIADPLTYNNFIICLEDLLAVIFISVLGVACGLIWSLSVINLEG